MKTLTKVPIEVSLHLRYLYQDAKLRGKKLLEKYPIFSKATIYRHATGPTPAQPIILDKRIKNKGRPRKLTERDERSIIRHIEI